MRSLVLMAALSAALSAAPAVASDTPDPPPIERRTTILELKAVAAEKRLADLEAKVFGVPAQMPPTVAAVPPQAAGVVPPNHHAHYDAAGRVVVHGNWNNGVPGAHAGMSPVRIAEAGQRVPGGIAAPTYSVRSAGGGCPAGGCPSPRAGLFSRWR